MISGPDRVSLLRHALIFHAAAKAQLLRAKSAQQVMLSEVSVDKWVNGEIPSGTRDAEFRFEYEYHFLLVAAAQLDKAMRKLGFAGLDKEIGTPLKELRDWYTHFEDPKGGAFQRFIARKEGADPAKLVLMADDIEVGGQVFNLSALTAALDKIEAKLPAYERRVLSESQG